MIRRRWSALVSALVVATTACGGSTTESTTTTSSLPQSRLLTLSDVGQRWKNGPAVTDEVFADATQVPCKGITLDADTAARLRPSEGVQFEPVDSKYLFMSELVTTGDATQLAADIDEYLAVERKCANTPDNGLLTFEEIKFPTLGDQQSVWVLSAYDTGSDTAVWHIRSAIVRVGGTMVNVNLTEVLETPTQALQVSNSEFARIVKAAVSRLSTAIG